MRRRHRQGYDPYYDYYGPPSPQPHIVILDGGGRSKRKRGGRETDSILTAARMDRFLEMRDKRKKDLEKDKKKDPNPIEKAIGFLQWVGFMTIVGLPIGLATVWFLGSVLKMIPVVLQNLVK